VKDCSYLLILKSSTASCEDAERSRQWFSFFVNVPERFAASGLEPGAQCVCFDPIFCDAVYLLRSMSGGPAALVQRGKTGNRV
jgi:hypothetical protein